MEKDFVPIFYDWLGDTSRLTAQQTGYLIDAVLIYFKDGGRRVFVDINSPKALQEAYIKTIDRIEKYFRSEYNGRSGEFHWNWQGGKTPVNQRERSSKEYADWRKAVFERDNFTCQMCGQVGGGLQAHHIKQWSTNVDERYQVSNGVTLCEKCHKELHRKGG
jgi:hypothetical protein